VASEPPALTSEMLEAMFGYERSAGERFCRAVVATWSALTFADSTRVTIL
jgi:hypothetical protein